MPSSAPSPLPARAPSRRPPRTLAALAIAMLGAALVGFAIFQASGAPGWFRVAALANLGGALAVVLALVPRAIERASTPRRRARAAHVAAVHALVELTALGCAAANVLATLPRLEDPPGDGLAALLGCGAAWALTVVGGWSGWTLAAHHRVGLAALAERAVRPRAVRPACPARLTRRGAWAAR